MCYNSQTYSVAGENPMNANTNGCRNERSKWVKVATGAAVCVASLLCLLKIGGWFITGSAAILGSLADSGIDLLVSVAAAGVASYAALQPDTNHKFGHHKAEALFALGQVALISASASLVLWESVHHLVDPEPVTRPDIAVGVLLFSLIATILLVSFQTLALKRTRSLIIQSDRAHYIGDIFAITGALLAVFTGSYYDIPRLDAVAGLTMGLVLTHSAWQVTKIAIPQLMDEELPEEDKETIKQILEANTNVLSYHALRTRRAGDKSFIQLDIQLDAGLSFREAHDITDEVELQIENAFTDADVIIHADPEGEARLERRVIEDVEDYPASGSQ